MTSRELAAALIEIMHQGYTSINRQEKMKKLIDEHAAEQRELCSKKTIFALVASHAVFTPSTVKRACMSATGENDDK